MKAIFQSFTFLGEVLVFLLGFALIALAITIVGKVFSFIAANIKSMLIAVFIIYVALIFFSGCIPLDNLHFYDFTSICSK